MIFGKGENLTFDMNTKLNKRTDTRHWLISKHKTVSSTYRFAEEWHTARKTCGHSCKDSR